MRETIVFFRDDDVGELTDAMRFHFDVLLKHEIPCAYQVVPNYLDDECAREIRRLFNLHPGLAHFNQHGLYHEQELAGARVHSEFAGGRSYAYQLRDIKTGRDLLADRLGSAFEADVFTPPCHKYDRETLRALATLGFKTLSAGVRIDRASRLFYDVGRLFGRVELYGRRVSYHQRFTPERRVAEVSVVIDVHQQRDASNKPVDKSADHLWQEFSAAREVLPAVGVMTHHHRIDSAEHREAFSVFTERLAKDPGVRFASLRDLTPTVSKI